MKIQLVEKVDEIGKVYYGIWKDEKYISGTLTFNFEEAVEMYNKVVENGKPKEPKILMETKINVQ